VGKSALRRWIRGSCSHLLCLGIYHAIRASAGSLENPIGARDTILVVAPHPDDETLACGGTIAAAVASGARVVVACATDGRLGGAAHGDVDNLVARRLDELTLALHALGGGAVELVAFDLEDGRLAESLPALASRLEEVVSRVRPNVVFSPSPLEPHPDHRAVGEAVRSVLTPDRAQLFEYLVWLWTQPRTWLGRRGATVREVGGARRVKIDTAIFRRAKSAALDAYRSQRGESGALAPRFLRFFPPTVEVFLQPAGYRSSTPLRGPEGSELGTQDGATTMRCE